MKYSILILTFVCLFFTGCGQEKKSNSNISFVFDYEHILTKTQTHVLDSIIGEFEAKTSNEIAIVTVDTLGQYHSLFEYAVDFGQKHGVGKKEKNNGLVIAFSKNLRQTFLATGYGTEKILKDEICKKIVDSTMVPRFKNQDYYGGLKAGLEECIRKWK